MDSLIAVLGTLAGGAVTGLLQHFGAARTERRARQEQDRRDRMAAVTSLAEAVSAHRAAMWALKDAELRGAPRERVDDLLDASHESRAAVTAPAVTVRLVESAPEVREMALAAVQATYSMREAVSLDDLQVRRRQALDAHDAFVEAASRRLLPAA